MLNSKIKLKLLSFLKDDIGQGDITSAVVPKKKCRAFIIAKENAILAGIEELKFLLSRLDAFEGEEGRKNLAASVLSRPPQSPYDILVVDVLVQMKDIVKYSWPVLLFHEE